MFFRYKPFALVSSAGSLAVFSDAACTTTVGILRSFLSSFLRKDTFPPPSLPVKAVVNSESCVEADGRKLVNIGALELSSLPRLSRR